MNPMNLANGSGLQAATAGVILIFIVSAGYSLVTYLLPMLAIPGIFLAFGLVANAIVVPSGLLLLALFGALLVIERGIKAIFGGLLLASAIGACVYGAYQSIAGFLSIQARAGYVADLPERTLNDRGNIRIVQFDWTSDAQCRFECMRLLLTGSITSFVKRYHSDSGEHREPQLEDLRYREFYVGVGPDCASPNIVSQDDIFSESFALYLLEASCVLYRDLAAPPDGVWVLHRESSRDKPQFEFRGQLIRIVLRENGEETLLIHNEAGQGIYPAFPPMFVAWFNSENPGIDYDWVSFWYSYGSREDWKSLVQRAVGLSLKKRKFPDRLIPGIMPNVRRFETAYADFQPLEKSRVFRSIAALLRERPDLFDRLRALVLRGLEDTDTVASSAIGALYGLQAADRHEMVPVILGHADRPGLSEPIVRFLLRHRTRLSSEDLYRIAEFFPDPPPQESYPFPELFKLLKKSGKNGHAALAHLLSRDSYHLQQTSACQLIDQGQAEQVRPHAEVFLTYLETHSWGGYSRQRCAAHTILRDIGLKGQAIETISQRLADPSLSSSDRENLQRRLDELE